MFQHEVEDYITNFNKEREKLETPEARDRLKLAQLFANSVHVKTAYDNTAYIVCLGALLSGAKVDAIKEIKKINPDIVDPAWLEERTGPERQRP